MLLSKKVIGIWNVKNRKHYESKGYKILRIVSDRKLPKEETIIEAINNLVNTSNKFYLIDMK